jgi:hypothetical protein
MWWVEKWLVIILGFFLILIVVLWLATSRGEPRRGLDQSKREESGRGKLT